jgi:excisionase family DNA binding protein
MDDPTETNQQDDKWLTLRESCSYLRISVPTAHRWIKKGILKPSRTPTGAYRLRRSVLDALIG